MQDRPTKLKEYQTYIDGKWVRCRLRQDVPDASIPTPASRGR